MFLDAPASDGLRSLLREMRDSLRLNSLELNSLQDTKSTFRFPQAERALSAHEY